MKKQNLVKVVIVNGNFILGRTLMSKKLFYFACLALVLSLAGNASADLVALRGPRLAFASPQDGQAQKQCKWEIPD
jgi:hypothetical protein